MGGVAGLLLPGALAVALFFALLNASSLVPILVQMIREAFDL